MKTKGREKSSGPEATIKEVEVAAAVLLHHFLSSGKLVFEKIPLRNHRILNAVKEFVEKQAETLGIHPAKILYWLAFPQLMGDEALQALTRYVE